jgi:hypothetical protein
MSTYPLTNIGFDIDAAIGKVHNADTSPRPISENMVTSGGVYTAVNNLDLTNLAGSALVTEADQIALNDNDDTIPTSAAVKDYVDTSSAISKIPVPISKFAHTDDLFQANMSNNKTTLTSWVYGYGASIYLGFSRAYAIVEIPEGVTVTGFTWRGTRFDVVIAEYDYFTSGTGYPNLARYTNTANPPSSIITRSLSFNFTQSGTKALIVYFYRYSTYGDTRYTGGYFTVA